MTVLSWSEQLFSYAGKYCKIDDAKPFRTEMTETWNVVRKPRSGNFLKQRLALGITEETLHIQYTKENLSPFLLRSVRFIDACID